MKRAPYVIAIVLVASSCYGIEFEKLTADEIAAAHARMVATAQPVSLKMVHTQHNFFGSEPAAAPKISPPWMWAKRDAQERLSYDVGSPPADNGLPTGLHEFFVNGDTTYMLRNWDRTHPQRLSPLNQGTVSARAYPTTGECPGRDVTRFLLWSFSLGLDLERWTLADLVRAKPGTEITQRHVVEGFDCIRLKIPGPDYLDHKWEGNFFLVFLIPERDFTCVQVVEHVAKMPGTGSDGAQTTYATDTTRTVKRWSDRGNNIFIPTQIETEIITQSFDHRRSTIETVVSDILIHDEVPADTFTFVIPEGTRVVYASPVHPESSKVVIWENNAPGKVITSLNDIPPDPGSPLPASPLRSALTTEPSERGSTFRLAIVAVNVLIVAALVVYLIIRNSSGTAR